MGWRNRPKYIENCPQNVDYIMFIDENGDSDLKHVINCKNKSLTPDTANVYFTISGVIINKDNLNSIKENINELKNKYWYEGIHKYGNNNKKVCFHSREIRRREGPFKDIKYDAFINDLSKFMENIPCSIISSTINKFEHVKKYDNPTEPYDLCLIFILERLVKYYLSDDDSSIIILESRGKKEDKKILEYMKRLLDNGTEYVSKDLFKKIKGIYFNSKWQHCSQNKKTYFGLEIADLYSYPIHKYCKGLGKDRAFKCLEKKIYKYPKYDGCGIKKFPKK